MAGDSTMRDYVSLQRGLTYKGNLVGKPGPALLGLGSIIPGGGFREGDFKTYGGECLPKHMLFSGDLFVSLKGATKDGEMIGSVARVPKSVPTGRLTQDTVGLRFHQPSSKTSNYIYWILRTPQYRDYCAGRATGSAVVALSREDFLDYPVPELTAVRAAIIDILEGLEQKIELNRRMNVTLEAMARALFQSWFVDFDPVRAKLDGRQPVGMDAATAHLFPASFEHDVDGKILPKGWTKTSLGDEVAFQTGFSFQSEFFTEGPPSIRLARGMNVKEGEFFWSNQSRYWPQVTPDIEQYQLTVGDVLIGMDGSKVGKNWVRVRAADLPCLLVQRVARLRETDSIGQNFIALLIGSPTFRDFVDAVKTGTSIPHISGGQIKSYSFLRPPRNDNRLFQQFESVVAPMTAQADKNHAEAGILLKLRDALLPKLLSGELSVSSV